MNSFLVSFVSTGTRKLPVVTKGSFLVIEQRTKAGSKSFVLNAKSSEINNRDTRMIFTVGQ